MAPESDAGARQPGLRERKKQRTQELIAETARRLFVKSGFDRVTIAEVAREAEVSEQTVFNYFPTKEDLFYSRLEAFEEEMLAAIRARKPGASALDAFKAFLLGKGGALEMEEGQRKEATRTMRSMTKVITESPALLARERQVFARYTQSLAELLAEETGSDPGDAVPLAAAGSMLAVHRSLIDYVRRRTLAGAQAPQVAREMKAQARKSFALLEGGLGDYAVKPG